VAFEARDVVFEAAQRALAEKRLVHLRYYVPSRDEVTERDVDPMRVALLAGRAYLEGWCRLSGAVRVFRLDRVVGIEVLDLPAEPPADAQGLDLTEQAPASALRVGESDPLVTLDLAPAARWVPEYYPCESVQESEDGEGAVRVTLRAADPDRIRRAGAAARRRGPGGRPRRSSRPRCATRPWRRWRRTARTPRGDGLRLRGARTLRPAAGPVWSPCTPCACWGGPGAGSISSRARSAAPGSGARPTPRCRPCCAARGLAS